MCGQSKAGCEQYDVVSSGLSDASYSIQAFGRWLMCISSCVLPDQQVRKSKTSTSIRSLWKKSEKVGVPTIQQLLEWSFINNNLQFAEVSDSNWTCIATLFCFLSMLDIKLRPFVHTTPSAAPLNHT